MQVEKENSSARKIKYEGHWEITDTPLAFWTLDETKNSSHSQVKREDGNGRKRETVGQQCSSTKTGAIQDWAMADIRCQLRPFNQSINHQKSSSLPKKFSEMDFTIT